MMKAMSGPKLLIIHPSSHKLGKGGASPASSASMSGRSFWLVVLLAVFTCVSLLTVFSTARAPSGAASPRVTFAVGADAASAGASGGRLPAYVFDALVRYAAAAGANSTVGMPEEDVRAIASVLRRRAPCNLLVFGLGAETPLWRALNHGGRTVFLDENPFYVAHMEGAHGPGLEYKKLVIDAYAYLSNVETATTSVLTTTESRKLVQEIEDIDRLSTRTKRWVEHIAKKFVGRRMVHVPLNVHKIHWLLLVFNFDKEELQVLNSSQGYRDEVKERNLVLSIQSCINQAINTGLVKTSQDISFYNWKTVCYTNIPGGRPLLRSVHAEIHVVMGRGKNDG